MVAIACLEAMALWSVPARADPPACHVDPAVVRAPLPFTIANTSVRIAAVAESSGALSVALRVMPRRGRGTTQVYAGSLDAHGAWTVPPRPVTSFPARVDGAIGLVAMGDSHRVLVAGTGVLRSVQLPASGEPVVTSIAATTPRADRIAVFAAMPGHFRLAWNTPRGIELRDIPVLDSEPPEAAHTAHVPDGTNVVSLAAGPDGVTGLVMRTSARRHVIATVDRAGRFHWSGNAPAGCRQHFCPAVQLHPAPGGFLATWLNRRDRDGLSVPGAWSLDAGGHGRGGRHEFLPMVHGVPVAGPHGEPLVLQLARPIVLRGASAPIAITPAPAGSLAQPGALGTIVHDEALYVLAAWNDASLSIVRVTCP